MPVLSSATPAPRAGDPETARATYAVLADIWHDADTDFPARTEVQEHATVGVR